MSNLILRVEGDQDFVLGKEETPKKEGKIELGRIFMPEFRFELHLTGN